MFSNVCFNIDLYVFLFTMLGFPQSKAEMSLSVTSSALPIKKRHNATNTTKGL